MSIYRIPKLISLAIFLLFLLHYESLHIGPLKISHLWKSALLFYLLATIIRSTKTKLCVYDSLVLLAFLQILNIEVINNPKNALVSFSLMLLFPAMGIYFLKLAPAQLERALIFVASFCILSFVPYKLGLLTSLGDGYSLVGYGVFDVGLLGPYQRVHSASAVLAGSLLIVTHRLLLDKKNRMFFLSLFLLGFYFLFYTYVRTGIAMYAMGFLPIAFYLGKKNLKNFIQILFFMAFVFGLLSTWVLSNDVLLKRITGERNYYKEDSIDTVGSGRLRFSMATVDYYSEGNLYEQLLGIGETEGLRRMSEKIGVRLFPHNGFLFLLSSNGLLGLILFIIFLNRFRKKAKKFLEKDKLLTNSLFIAYLTLTFFQSYDNFYFFVLLSLSFASGVKKMELCK